MERKTIHEQSSSSLKKNKQTTLFQNWGHGQGESSRQNEAAITEMDDQLDEETLLAACEEWESEGVGLANPQQPLAQGVPHGTPLEDLPGFDVSAGHIYIYPVNYPLRDYQFNIVQQALFRNTLVTLPTGLGKTFIAAVVMYNFYRWYPRGKIVFMAPTKPLVFQQIEACFNIMGIPQTDMAEMTGNMPPTERKKSWQRQRVFFLTPQVMTNDLSRRACPVMDVKCVVVDEAHKALGNHAYCQVVRELSKYTSQYRVLALSATPGGDIKAVNQVLSNLLISHIEIRSEDSIDIKRYVHERKVEKIVVPLGDELKRVRGQYLDILNVYVQRLVRARALFCRDPATMTKFQILKSREAFRQDPPPGLTNQQRGPIEGDFAICMSLYHGFELLLQHGQRSLYTFLLSIADGSKGISRTRNELIRNPNFSELMDALQEKYGNSSTGNSSHNGSLLHNRSGNSSGLFTSMMASSRLDQSGVGVKGRPGGPGGAGGGGDGEEREEYLTSHPKMAKLKEVVIEHFEKFSTANSSESGPSTSKDQPGSSTRVMIFAQYRESVQEITDMLNHHRPSIRCMSFIGQASAGKNTKGFTQKEQIRVVNEFRSGGYNTLVSTCVGEEGLDIGDVDLIVCYDAHKSPIRLVQRMGRTGRKREGRIVMLVTEGKEAAIYDRSQYSKKGIHKALQSNSKALHLYPCSPRMVPKGLQPVPHKMNITVGTYQSKHKPSKPVSSKASNKRKSSMGGDISKFMQGVKRDPAQDVFLTYEELAFWNLHYKTDSTEQLKPPTKSSFLSFKKQEVNNDPATSSDGHLSLSAFTEWQTTQNPTHKVSHSRRTTNFVEMMEFIEIQGQTEDEDIYGAEMVLYLDDGDVLKPRTKKSAVETGVGILKYCSQEGKKSKRRKDEEPHKLSEDVDDSDCNAAKGKEKLRQGSGGKSTGDSDDDLPVVNLAGDPNEKLDGIENEGKGKNYKKRKKVDKKQKSPRVSDDGKVGKTRRKSKSPHSDKNSSVKRLKKAVPLPIDSDDEDFDCGTEKVHTNTTVKADHTKEDRIELMDDRGDEQSTEDAEPMDTASDDDLPIHSAVPDEVVDRKQSEEPQRKSTRSLSIGSDTTFNASDIFLSCSQVFKNPDEVLVPSSSKATRKRKSSEGESLIEDEMMPPPPPSLSALDFLDDVDLSFSATQLTKTSTFQEKSPQRHSDSKSSFDKPTEYPVEEKEDICGTNQISHSAIMMDEVCSKPKELPVNQSFEDDDLFYQEDEHAVMKGQVCAKSKVELPASHSFEDDDLFYQENKHAIDADKITIPEISSSVNSSKPIESNVYSKGPEEENKSDLKDCKNETYLTKQQGDNNHQGNITDQLAQAWENFEGDIFGDDDDDIFDDVDSAAKTGITETTKEPPNTNKDILRKEVMNEADKHMECNISTASAGVQSKPNASLKQTVTMPTNIGKDVVKGPSAVIPPAVDDIKTGSKTEVRRSSNVKDNNLEKETAKPPPESRPDDIVQPKFDLDFDFGDFFDMDDEMFDKIDVLPPSPQVKKTRSGFMCLSQVSQSSNIPTHTANSSKPKTPPIMPGTTQVNMAADTLDNGATRSIPFKKSSEFLFHGKKSESKSIKEVQSSCHSKADKLTSGKPKNPPSRNSSDSVYQYEQPELKNSDEVQSDHNSKRKSSLSRFRYSFKNPNDMDNSVPQLGDKPKVDEYKGFPKAKDNTIDSGFDGRSNVYRLDGSPNTKANEANSPVASEADNSVVSRHEGVPKVVEHQPAASTPVVSGGSRSSLKHRDSSVSPIEPVEPSVEPMKEDTPVSRLKPRPNGALRNRLSTKRKSIPPKEVAPTSNTEKVSSVFPTLPTKRKSSPLVEEGHFDDATMSNPLKKHRTSPSCNQNGPGQFGTSTFCNQAGSRQFEDQKPLDKLPGHDLDGRASRDDIDLLLEDINWEDSLMADVSMKSGKKTMTQKEEKNNDASSPESIEDLVSDEDSDDDIGRLPRRKKQTRAILISPDTPSTGRTPIRSKVTASRSTKKNYTSVESNDEFDDTSFISRPKKRKARKILDTSSILVPDASDDEDFADSTSHVPVQTKLAKAPPMSNKFRDVPLRERLQMKAGKMLTKKEPDTHHRNPSRLHQEPSRRRRGHRMANFLDDEVEVSEDEVCSSDEEGSELDSSLEGFINNATQLSQDSCPQDMHALYLKSVRSPAGNRNRFKMVHRSPGLDVFSQVPQQDASYMEDSFVVQGGDDDVDHDEDEEVSIVAMENTINLDNIIEEEGRRTRGQRRLRSRGGESRAAKILRAGRAAVLRSDSSSSEPEVEDLLDWDADFGENRTSKRRHPSRNDTTKRREPVAHHQRFEKPKMHSVASTEWLSKPSTFTSKNDHMEERKSRHSNQISGVEDKAPLRTNKALMNSVGLTKPRIDDSEPGFSKPCTFVVPQPPAPPSSCESSGGDGSQTLAQREKEERLRRQHQKQAEFLQKLQQKQNELSASVKASQSKSAVSVSGSVRASGQQRRSVYSCDERRSDFQNSTSSSFEMNESKQNDPKFSRDSLSMSSNDSMRKVSTSDSGSYTWRDSMSKSSIDSGSHSSNDSVSKVKPFQGNKTSTNRSQGVRQGLGGNAPGSNRTILNTSAMNNTIANATMSTTAVNAALANRTMSSPKTSAVTGQDPAVILVDSKELASAPHMVSTLTITHGLNPIVSQLQGCDYVASTRMGVEKRTLSEFSKGANQQKLIDRVRHMCDLFDRPCLIIERDRVKTQDKKQPKIIPRTKYLDSTLTSLAKTHVKVLFSESTEDTAHILADLVRMEGRKGMGIPAIPDMDTITEQVLKFYQSIPGVSYVTALSLMHHFPSIQDLATTCASILQARIKVSSVRARQIISYVNHRFDEQMTGSR